jgi:hypothetical protein
MPFTQIMNHIAVHGCIDDTEPAPPYIDILSCTGVPAPVEPVTAPGTTTLNGARVVLLAAVVYAFAVVLTGGTD